MKKLIAMVLVLCMILGLTACGSGSGTTQTTQAAAAATTAQEDQQAAEAPQKKLVVATVVKAIGSNWFDSMDWEGTKWAEKVPIDLPIYNIAGDQDPVGEYGVGVYQVSNWLIQTGHTVTTKLYSGYRHEIHNYAEIKNEVEAGIIAFMDGILS